MRFGRTDFQKEFPFNPTGDRFHDSFSRFMAPCKDHKIISVSDKGKPSGFQFLIEFVEVDV